MIWLTQQIKELSYCIIKMQLRIKREAGNAFVDSDPDEDRPRRHAPPYGTSSFVVGTFGMFAAGKITELLLAAGSQK